MQERVECQGRPGHPCGAHRDLALSARCLICGSVAAKPVRPTIGDCYTALARWAGELADLSQTPETLAIVAAVTVGARLVNHERAPRG